tara:strand:- start:651 stop:962 length:312 start_codon:yes stop_codon:yes gene_type:complete
MNDSQKLMNMRNMIEKMNNVHHIKFFEILKNNNIPFSENRNGIFFNMNSFDNKIIEQINNYINYVQKQENNLKKTEKLKSDFKNEYFKDNKEKKESNIYHNVA